MEFLEQFSYIIKYKKGKTNVVVDALSRRYNFLSTLRSQILGFDNVCELYLQDQYFALIYKTCEHKSQEGFYVNNGYLFKEGRVCIPLGSHRNLLIYETHEGGFMGHFGVVKTLAMLKEKFFLPHVRKEVQRYCSSCITSLHAKSTTMPSSLYTPLPIGFTPWEDISMNFVQGLLITSIYFCVCGPLFKNDTSYTMPQSR